ncbi:Hypothetical protein, putative [Bodo saltans]|uniref:Membrane-associated protein n=1 Tax=Bodo saltans TaxID=75058 RepID=A0A0S4JRM9_BODSA|nr:Hypothetical protein, putative [Bodo saltans]|eukprot:CUG92640.1 Hypothetical protein, putative [Bodo saltans]
MTRIMTRTTTLSLRRRITLAAMLVAVLCIPRAASTGEGCTLVTQRVQCRSLTCNTTSGDCMLCTNSAQCYQEAYGCNDYGHCVLMPLSNTFTLRTLLAPVVGFCVCAIAVLAGVGGGAILSPLFNVILEIPFSDAVALAQCAILGQSLLNVIMQMPRTHRDHSAPMPTRPNINYEYACLLLPIALSGTFLGSVANKIAPNWLRVVLLILLFSNALYRLIKRMIAEKKASEMMTIATAAAAQEEGGMTTVLASTAGGQGRDVTSPMGTMSMRIVVVADVRGREERSDDSLSSPAASVGSGGVAASSPTGHATNTAQPTKVASSVIVADPADSDEQRRAQHIGSLTICRRHPYWCLWGTVTLGLSAMLLPVTWLRAPVLGVALILLTTQYVDYIRKNHELRGIVEESPQLPTQWLLFCAVIIVVFSSISYLTKHAIDCGGTVYYAMLFVVPTIGMLMSFSVRRHLARLYEKVQLNELPSACVPFEWSTKTTIVFPLLCVVAGFAATMLGIGGGLVLSSLLLEAGLAPAHASATSGLATLLIASQSVITLIIGDKLRADYGMLCFAAGMLSTIFGRLVLLRQIEKRDATYLIVAALAFIMGGSMVAVIAYGVYNTYTIFTHDGSLGFGPMCTTDAVLTTTTTMSS